MVQAFGAFLKENLTDDVIIKPYKKKKKTRPGWKTGWYTTDDAGLGVVMRVIYTSSPTSRSTGMLKYMVFDTICGLVRGFGPFQAWQDPTCLRYGPNSYHYLSACAYVEPSHRVLTDAKWKAKESPLVKDTLVKYQDWDTRRRLYADFALRHNLFGNDGTYVVSDWDRLEGHLSDVYLLWRDGQLYRPTMGPDGYDAARAVTKLNEQFTRYEDLIKSAEAEYSVAREAAAPLYLPDREENTALSFKRQRTAPGGDEAVSYSEDEADEGEGEAAPWDDAPDASSSEDEAGEDADAAA